MPKWNGNHGKQGRDFVYLSQNPNGNRMMKRKKHSKYGDAANPMRDSMGAYSMKMPFTPRFRCAIRFDRAFQLTTSTTVNVGGSEQVFSPNNAYQPDFTGNNHQPYGYDQLTPLYARWIVHACHIQITVSSSAASKPCALLWSTQPYNASYQLAGETVDKGMEKPMNGHVLLDTTGRMIVRNLNLIIPKIEGLSATQYESEIDLYSGAAASAPTRSPFFRMALFNLLDNTQPTAQVVVSMTFDITFFDRIILGSS